eukprot:3952875-Pleurochrysis_carterae.AAC.3
MHASASYSSRVHRGGSVSRGSDTSTPTACIRQSSGGAPLRFERRESARQACSAILSSPRQRNTYVAAASAQSVRRRSPPAVSRPHNASSGGQTTPAVASSGIRYVATTLLTNQSKASATIGDRHGASGPTRGSALAPIRPSCVSSRRSTDEMSDTAACACAS